MTSTTTARRDLRSQVRAARRDLSRQQRRFAAEHCADQLIGQSVFRNAHRIAAYLPADGELDPTPIIERAWHMGKQVYLPVLIPQGENRLWFAEYHPDTTLVANRFGILEPCGAVHTRVHPLALDLVLTPLVAFDALGHRLGMGGGYYDRSFAYLRRHRIWLRPRLIGLAYDFQRQARLPAAVWDVALQGIATDCRFYRCR